MESAEKLENSQDSDNLGSSEGVGSANGGKRLKNAPDAARGQSTPEVFAFNAQFAPESALEAARTRDFAQRRVDGRGFQNYENYAPEAEDSSPSEESLSFGGDAAPRAHAAGSASSAEKRSHASRTEPTAQISQASSTRASGVATTTNAVSTAKITP